MSERIVYRCRKCGKLAYGHQVEPGDDLLPMETCSCYMGPKWERGVWISVEDVRGLRSSDSEERERVECSRPGCTNLATWDSPPRCALHPSTVDEVADDG